jgi:polysaccharide export outer membrane protein
MMRRTSRFSAGFLLAVLAGLLGPMAWAAAPAAQADVHPSSSHSSGYIIGPGDVLSIFVWQNPNLSLNAVPVRPDGRISTPLIASMRAAGRTPVQLAKAMDKALRKYVRDPRVTIIVEKALGVLSQVQVIGQVVHPESMPYYKGMTVLDAVLAAGGLTPYAAGNDAKLEREVNGHVVTIHVHLYNLINKGELSQNRPVKPGDILVVPESFF